MPYLYGTIAWFVSNLHWGSKIIAFWSGIEKPVICVAPEPSEGRLNPGSLTLAILQF